MSPVKSDDKGPREIVIPPHLDRVMVEGLFEVATNTRSSVRDKVRAKDRLIEMEVVPEEFFYPRAKEKARPISPLPSQGNPRPGFRLVTGPNGEKARTFGEAVMVRVADVQSRMIEYLWPGRFALGKLTLIAGDPGLGKSFVSLSIAAHVTTGAAWPDDPDALPVTSGSVIMLSAEDDIEDTIKPRLEQVGADTERCHCLTTVKQVDGRLAPFSIARDMPSLEEALVKLGDCRLVIIDPVSAYLDGVDEHKNSEVRRAIGPLSDLAAKHRVAVVMVTHLNKGTGPKAIYRSTGSLAFVAASRMAWLVSEHHQDKHLPQNKRRRVMVSAKCNIAAIPTGLSYSFIDNQFVWSADPVIESADEVLEMLAEGSSRGDGVGARGPVPEKTQQAMAWLVERLEAGPVRKGQARKLAEDEGIAPPRFYDAIGKLGKQVEEYELEGRKWLRSVPVLALDDEEGGQSDASE
jgi:putative DNA primase/helicase